MSARLQTVLYKLASLPCWRPLRAVWNRVHSWLASKLDNRPGLVGWLWRLVHVREWQKSSALSALIFALNTALVYRLVALLGHGWQLNLAVSLVIDAVMYGFNKRWVWEKRKAAITTSAAWSFLWWLVFLGFNTGIAYLLMKRADIGTLEAKSALGGIGIALNPVVFMFRDRVAFRQVNRTTAELRMP